MNCKRLCAAAALLMLCVTGCGKGNDRIDPDAVLAELTETVTETQRPTTSPSPTQPVTATDTTEAATEEPAPLPLLPVLSIQTVQQGDNALDFVTKPVAPYVAEASKKWTFGKLPPVPYYEACTVSLTDTENNLVLDGVSADIKVRGNWTSYYDKKPLRIKFAEKQTVLGLHEDEKFRNWVLLAEYKDPSMLRNKTAFSISREILGSDGLYASDAAFVELEINGEYWGVYLLAEQQQVNHDRIDVTKPEEQSTDVHIGYLLEYDGYYNTEDDLHKFRVSYADNAPLKPYDGNGGSSRTLRPMNEGYFDRKRSVGMSIKSEISTKEQHDYIASYVGNVYNILYAAAYQKEAWIFNEEKTEIVKSETLTPRQAIERVINVQSLVDMYIISEIMCDADLNWSSFFMDVDLSAEGSGQLTFEAPWDFDSALGIKDRCADGNGFYAANIIREINDEYDTINPWLAVLANEDWFQKKVRITWTKHYEDGVFTRALEQITQDTETYADAFARNHEKWGIPDPKNEKALAPKAAECKTQKEAADYLESWLRRRVEFLNSWWYSDEEEETTEPPTEPPSETESTAEIPTESDT